MSLDRKKDNDCGYRSDKESKDVLFWSTVYFSLK